MTSGGNTRADGKCVRGRDGNLLVAANTATGAAFKANMSMSKKWPHRLTE